MDTLRKSALFIALIALMAFGAGQAGAAAKVIKYRGSSTKGTATKLLVEGRKSPKGPWPSVLTVTLTNATATCPVEPGVTVPYAFTEHFNEYPVEVSLKNNTVHPGWPNFHRKEQFTAGSETEEGKYATTETYFHGEFTPNGKKGTLGVLYTFTVSPTAIGSKEAEPVCHYEDSFSFKPVK
jgi:hypothetical protein